MRKRFLIIAALCAISASFQQVPKLNETDTSALIKASYLYHFSKLVDWPAQAKTGNFIISVMGSTSVYQELVKKYNAKQIGSQQIEVRKLTKTLNISNCHVLYVGKECEDILPDIIKALKNEPTLIVSDASGALKKGADINFIVEDTKLLFELSVKNATDKDLFIGSTLKSLATRIQ